jgi:hypothetical protein
VIKEKIKNTDIIITETKMDRLVYKESFKNRPSSDSLFIVLSKEDADYIAGLFRKTTAEISKYTAGELLIKLQTNYPRLRCSVINKKDTLTMDEYTQIIGRRLGKQSYNLETDSFQVGKINGALAKYDWAFFKRNAPLILSLYRNKKTNEVSCYALNQYASFAIDYKFKETCNFLKGTVMTNDEFVKKRNEDWMRQLPGLLEKNNCFIAVGFGHLCNQCGLIKQLESLGYIIEPVSMK